MLSRTNTAPIGPTSIRGSLLNCRFGVNGIQNGSRSFGTVCGLTLAADAVDDIAIISCLD